MSEERGAVPDDSALDRPAAGRKVSYVLPVFNEGDGIAEDDAEAVGGALGQELHLLVGAELR